MLAIKVTGDLLYSLDYEILEICKERKINKLDFDNMPYDTKVEILAHWEISQEIQEHYHQKIKREAERKR